MRRLRLINPRNPLNHLVESDVARRVTFGRKAVFMPLGLAVAAGVVPRAWHVEIVDECTRPVPVAKDVDLVGVTAMTCQAPRAYAIADAYRRLGVPVILGGIHPSALPEEALGHATAVAVGEAEGTLPLLAALRRGRIGTWGSFLLGFDCDTVESLRETVAFARRARLGISCYPILTPYPGTPLFDDYAAEGRILTRDWSKYNGATVVFEPKRMTARQLANCQMAAFREFYAWPSLWERLDLWPPQTWAWIINISINQGFRYYYRREHRPMPDFREAHLWEAPAGAE